jgi:hypothetical protein
MGKTPSVTRREFVKGSALAGAGAIIRIDGAKALQEGSAAETLTNQEMRRQFRNPPNSAKPRVWWHWMNGNVTKEGIDLDLHWMKRIGIGGFQNFNADLNTPQIVEKRLAYMTPEWKDAFLYATKMADHLDLEEAIASSPGWSETGGPWVPASQAMKKYVWSETRVEGGKPFKGMLPQPPRNTGPFQNVPYKPRRYQPKGVPAPPEFYADTAVVAYRIPEGELSEMVLLPKITFSGDRLDVAMLTDGDLSRTTQLPIPPPGGTSWIQYDFIQPQTIQSLTFAQIISARFDARVGGPGSKTLEASDDGKIFRTIVSIPNDGAIQHTLSFPAVTARLFRVIFKRIPSPASLSSVDLAVKPDSPISYEIAQLELHPGPRVNRFEEKAAFEEAFAVLPDIYNLSTPPVDKDYTIRKENVFNVTSKLHADGTLDWTPPAGIWMICRFGYSLLGTPNHPPTAEAFGLEVDKLNGSYVKNYIDHYLGNFKSTVGSSLMGANGIKYMVSDSWEAGAQNWTDDMVAEFTRRRGYDPHPWMPVLAGHIVEGAEESDKFLWDFRKTIADLTADYHYGQIKKSLSEFGMGHYGEAHEKGRAFIGDGMEVKKYDDIPMGAMWVQSAEENREPYGADADLRESASVAHIYGQNLTGAESMTATVSPWAWSPATLKPTADKEMAEGVNLFVIHCSVHQPLVDKAPGMTLGNNGQFFTRHETWAEQASPWVSYLARSCYLLQQGKFVADVIYFYGEDSNLTAIFADKSPDIPEGYGFDYINANGLIHELHVTDGHITTGSGMSYHVLALDAYSRHMSLPVLQAIYKLVEQGAIVAGVKPIYDPSLADDPDEFRTLSERLFGDGSGVHQVGRGAVYAGQSAEDALNALEVFPDFTYTHLNPDTKVLFVHRKVNDGDIYYINNRNSRPELIEATFRVTGKSPELWYADTGNSEPVSYIIANGRTTVPLLLEPRGTVFVVFSHQVSALSRTVPRAVETTLMTVSGSWDVSFQAGRGAPASTEFDLLSSWSDNQDEGVKYFSGKATYTKIIHLPATWFSPASHLWLDLGDVKNLADITINGKPLGIVWKAPYKVDATSVLHPGANTLMVAVTNAWVNRLIGDQQPNATHYAFTVYHPYTAESPLLPSGLLGPVRISSVTVW